MPAARGLVTAAGSGQLQPSWIHRLDRLHLLTPMRIVLIMLAALLVTYVVRRLVNRALRRREVVIPGSDPVRVEARTKAMANVLGSAVLGIVWAAAVISIISELGINIGAFVATATIVGGAIAFGAQTLVRDVIAGFFVIAEDQYGVGDRVDLGLATGAVERISLRSVRLRDPDGKIWYVPHGGVARVGNMSQVTSVRLDVQVTRASKVADLRSETSALGERLVERMGDVLTGPPVVVGLVELSDDRLVYRLTAPIRAGKQDEVSRAWRSLLVESFESGALVGPATPETVVHVEAGGLGVSPQSVTEPQ